MKESRNAFRAVLGTAARAYWPVGLFTSGVNLLGLTVPLYLMLVFDRVLSSGSRETLFYLTLMAFAGVLALVLLDYARALVGARIAAWVDRTASPEAYERSVAAALDGGGYGEQSLRDLALLRGAVGGPAVYTLFDALWMPVYLLVVALLHWALGLVALVGMALLIVLGLISERAIRAPVQESTRLGIAAQRDIDAGVRNAEAVDAMGLTGGLVERWRQRHALLLDAGHAIAARSAAVLAGTRFVRYGMQITLLAVGAWLALNGLITGGAIIGASIIMGRAVAPVEQAFGMWRQVVAARDARRRLDRFFDRPTRHTGTAPPPPKGGLAVEAVRYIPPGSDRPLLNDVSLTVAPGEMLAVVGASGSGKSTLSRLLVGVWRPEKGAVRLAGADVWSWPRADFGRHVGYLPQDVELLDASVRDNIARMGAVDDGAVFSAARMAGVHEMILRLPNGYDTVLGAEGVRLSGGQRQRIALARALLNLPRLVVLDEPNANLDRDGEAALAHAIDGLKAAGAIVVVVTHRQRLLNQAERVLVLHGGTVAAFGPREEVLERLAPNSLAAAQAKLRRTG